MDHMPQAIIDLKSLTPREIDQFCASVLGQKAGQGTRVSVWLYRRLREEFDAMTDLNRPFREQLKSHCTISKLPVTKRTTSKDGTEKLLYLLEDGNTVEGVIIPGPGRLTLCVSTQVGCASGCGFCLTGSGGLVRNLTVAEIVNQVFAASLIAGGQTISNIVLMGTGEPLSNYEPVKSFVEIATDRSGMGLSPRKVTLSTCGLAPMIEKLANDGVDVSLAVSLNATTDEVRDRIMPVNQAYPLERLMQAVRYYCDTTGRTVTIEYVLFKGMNDSPDDAKRLMDMLKDLPCMINILLFNPFPGCSYDRPDEQRAFVMRDMLVTNGFVTVVRNSRGRDISAACGQLSVRPSPL
ncbi:MAG TPA: 23S rRNA (adenine(2503)-C(2))-methyltransferase RlmN [Nitrospirota bacterium]|nr:23S rRNA (adenine(2503)-C(2))-methyltransferase RlmN [Nitrospirota bacterium]